MSKIGAINECSYSRLINENPMLLTEALTIDKAIATFNTIPQDVVRNLIMIDPTYKGGDNVGKFFTWIANSYLNDQSIANNPEQSKELLTIFKDNQNRFTQQTNLKQFQTIEQVKQFLSQQGMLNQENDGDEISNGIDNAEVRQGTKVVLNGKSWLIIVPTNYAADRHWGADTSWCTAADNGGNYYNKYLEDYGGQYYILINKNDDSEKYQFHFESRQFMDADDRQIGSQVYDLINFEELDKFFTQEIGEDWANKIEEEGDDYEEEWEIEDTFSNYPTINICFNNATGSRRLKNEYGEDVLDVDFDEISRIEEETGCAEFKNDSGYGLLYIKQDRRYGERIETYIEGLTSISDWDYLDNEDNDWFYIGKTTDGSFKLITNYPETMNVNYNNILLKTKVDSGTVLVVDGDNGIGIMEKSFQVEEQLQGEQLLNAPSKQWVIIRNSIGNGCYMYNIETKRIINVPLEGRVGVIGYWMIGFVNNTKNAFDLHNMRFLFGQPLQGNADFIVNTRRSKENPTFEFMTNPEIIYDTFGGKFYKVNAQQYSEQQDKYTMISMEDAYQIIQNSSN